MKHSLLCLVVLLLPWTVSALDMSEQAVLVGHLRLGLSGSDKFGYTIGHELQDEHDQRMKPLENEIGFGVSLSYRRGITPSVLIGVSVDYLKSGTMKGEGVDEVREQQAQTDTLSGPLGSYELYGLGVSLHPGITLTEQMMLFAELGLGGYTARIAGNAQELNAALNVGLALDYFLSESLGFELSARMPLFLSEFVFLDEGYSLDPSPLQISLGVTWLR
jgi:hypothetical protein